MTDKKIKKTKKAKKSKKLQLVYIEWHDAIAGSSNWSELKDKKKWGSEINFIVRQVGWLIEKNLKYISFATSWCPADDYEYDKFCNMMKIPRTWIRKFEVLKEFDCEVINGKRTK